MTRKDFELIARGIATYTDNLVERSNLAEHFASVLSTTNPRFDRDRFVNACRGLK